MEFNTSNELEAYLENRYANAHKDIMTEQLNNEVYEICHNYISNNNGFKSGTVNKWSFEGAIFNMLPSDQKCLLYEHALKLDSTNHRIFKIFGKELYDLGLFTQALKCLNHMLKFGEDAITNAVIELMACCEDELGNTEKARDMISYSSRVEYNYLINQYGSISSYGKIAFKSEAKTYQELYGKKFSTNANSKTGEQESKNKSYDTFNGIIDCAFPNFNFKSSSIKIYENGILIGELTNNSTINFSTTVTDGRNVGRVNIGDPVLSELIKNEIVFDRFITLNDRLAFINIPNNNFVSESMALTTFRQILGNTRENYTFADKEPFCCCLYTIDQNVKKVTFSNPYKNHIVEIE